MTLIYIPPAFNMAVAIVMTIVTVVVLYYALIVGYKQLDLGKGEEMVVYGKSTKPIHGNYNEKH